MKFSAGCRKIWYLALEGAEPPPSFWAEYVDLLTTYSCATKTKFKESPKKY